MSPHGLPPTRRLPRPAPPQVPEGWSYHAGVGCWEYVGDLVDCTEQVPFLDLGLEGRIEEAEARLALLRYLRALRVYQSRSGDTTEQAPSAGVTTADGDPPLAGDGREGSPHTSEVAP